MANNPSAGQAQKANPITKKDNPFTMTNEEIITLVHGKQYHNDQPEALWDENKLFIVVQNILRRSTQIVDEVLGGGKASLGKTEEQSPNASFTIPLSVLKRIGCELSCCRASAAETAHEATLEIFRTLKNYSWQAKALLTLASFAMEFGDFWLLVELDQSNKQNQLTKSLGILKGAFSLTDKTQDPLRQQKRRAGVVELNKIIKATLNVMEIIIEIENLAKYDPTYMAKIPTSRYVFWVIITVVASASKVSILTSNDDEVGADDWSSYEEKIVEIKAKLVENLTYLQQLEDEHKRSSDLVRNSSDTSRIVEFLKGLLLSNTIIDASEKDYKTVEINVLAEKKKNLLIIVSQPEISDADIKIFKEIQTKKIKNFEGDYGLVWIPVVEENKQEYEKVKDFGGWVKSKGIEWYSTAQFVSDRPVIRFVKKHWNYKSDPIVVVLNMAKDITIVEDKPKGRVDNLTAYFTIRLWGLEAFPFDEAKESKLFNEMNWVPALFAPDSAPKFAKKDKDKMDYYYVFLYGGTDEKKTKDMEEKINGLQKLINEDNTIFKDVKITIKPYNVEEKEDIKNRFWSGVDTLFLAKLRKPMDTPKHEIQKLFSYKNKEGWFILNKGDNTIILGHCETFFKVVGDFAKWKENAGRQPFEVAFKDYYLSIVASLLEQIGCCRIEIPSNAGKLTEDQVIKCAECGADMTKITSYECCHKTRPIKFTT